MLKKLCFTSNRSNQLSINNEIIDGLRHLSLYKVWVFLAHWHFHKYTPIVMNFTWKFKFFPGSMTWKQDPRVGLEDFHQPIRQLSLVFAVLCSWVAPLTVSLMSLCYAERIREMVKSWKMSSLPFHGFIVKLPSQKIKSELNVKRNHQFWVEQFWFSRLDLNKKSHILMMINI